VLFIQACTLFIINFHIFFTYKWSLSSEVNEPYDWLGRHIEWRERHVLLKTTHYFIFSDSVPRFMGYLMFRISPFDINIFSKSSRKFANCGESRKRKLVYLLTSCFLKQKCQVTFAPYYTLALRKNILFLLSGLKYIYIYI
jgi:hypothetical protein